MVEILKQPNPAACASRCRWGGLNLRRMNMNRFKCPRCGGNQYTAADEAEECIYCGHQGLKKMDTLEEKSLDGRTWDEMPE